MVFKFRGKKYKLTLSERKQQILIIVLLLSAMIYVE